MKQVAEALTPSQPWIFCARIISLAALRARKSAAVSMRRPGVLRPENRQRRLPPLATLCSRQQFNILFSLIDGARARNPHVAGFDIVARRVVLWVGAIPFYYYRRWRYRRGWIDKGNTVR
jgi:hypothetical protein